MWKTGLIVATLVVLIGCSPGTDDRPAAAQDARTAQAQLPEAPPPDSDGQPDPAVVQKLIDSGAEPDEAHWLALTAWNASSPEPGVAHIVLTYPWGDTSRIELRVRRVDAGEVKPPEILEASVEPGRVSAAIRYYVPEEDLPELNASTLSQAPGTRGFDLVGVLIPAAHAQSSGSGGFGQVFQRWLTETASSEIRDKLLGAAAGVKLGGKISKALDVANAGKELQDLSDEARKRMKELDDMRKCAEDNPNGVEWLPGEKEKILQQIEQARVDIIANETVKGIDTVGGVVIGVLSPGLGTAGGFALDWSKDELEQLIEQRMDEIRRSVSKHCTKKRYRIGGCALSGVVEDVDKAFSAAGPTTFSFSGGRSGTWRWTAEGARGEGPYHITLDEGERSGRLTLPPGLNFIGAQTIRTVPWECTLTAIGD